MPKASRQRCTCATGSSFCGCEVHRREQRRVRNPAAVATPITHGSNASHGSRSPRIGQKRLMLKNIPPVSRQVNTYQPANAATHAANKTADRLSRPPTLKANHVPPTTATATEIGSKSHKK